jgi:hypothetical protein
MEGNVALFPLTLRCLRDFNSPPSTTSHRTESVVLDFTNSDIIPPAIKQKVTASEATKFYKDMYRFRITQAGMDFELLKIVRVSSRGTSCMSNN